MIFEATNLDYVHFAMCKIKYSMQDWHTPCSEFQQTTAFESCVKFCHKSSMTSCWPHAWFYFYKGFLVLLVTSTKLPLSQILNHTTCDVYTPKTAETLQPLPVTHAPSMTFFSFQKLSFGGRQSNVSMTIVVFILCHFHGMFDCRRIRYIGSVIMTK